MTFLNRLKLAWRNTTIVNKLSFFLTVVIAGANIAYVVFASKQFHAMDGQLQQMKRSTTASLQSAYDACLSAQIARSALIEAQTGATDTHDLAIASFAQAAAATRAEAAEITIVSADTPVTVHISDGKVYIPTIVSNIGKSAALQLKILGELKLFRVGTGKTLDLHFDKGALNTAESGAFAQDTHHQYDLYLRRDGKIVTFTRDEIMRQVVSPDEYLFFYGKITYKDAFSVKRKLNFCFLSATAKNVIFRYLKQCADYNTTDISRVIPPSPKAAIAPPQTIVCTAPKEDR